MTGKDFKDICDLHGANPKIELLDTFVLKILKTDKIKNSLFNHITLSTYIQQKMQINT